MSLYEIVDQSPLTAPAFVASLNGWVDAGVAGTTAGAYIAQGGDVVVTFDPDQLIDYRARRPVLHIENGVLSSLAWSDLTIRRIHADKRDILVLTGPEPDYKWHAFQGAIEDIAAAFGVVDSLCLGAIAATVPHTHATPILSTGSARSSGSDLPLPEGSMQVPASALNLIEIGLGKRGVRSGGIWAQVPHYVEGTYFAGALALVERATSYLGVHLSLDGLVKLVQEQRARLDAVVADRPDARAYVDQLEQDGGPITPVPGEDIADELERFLRESTEGGRNPFEDPPTEGG